MALLIASRALELKHESANHLVTFTKTDDDSERISAVDKADEARVCEECLRLLDEFASGKKRDTEEPVAYCEVVLKVTNTTK